MRPQIRPQHDFPSGPPPRVRGAGNLATPGAERRRPPATIRVARRFRASPQRVFRAFLDPALARAWLFATATRPIVRAAIDARVAGSFRLAERWHDALVEHRGEYLEIVPYRRLAFTLFADRARVTRVIVDIAPSSGGCRLALAHEGVPAGDPHYGRARWTGMLYGLAATLDALPAPIDARTGEPCNIC